MNDQKILPDDPQITAYALGELEGETLERVAESVRADPALQAAVAEISLFAAALGRALAQEAAEPLPPVTATRRFPNLFRLPAVVTLAGGLAAAVMFVTSIERKSPLRPAPGGEPSLVIPPQTILPVRANPEGGGVRQSPAPVAGLAVATDQSFAAAGKFSAPAKASKDIAAVDGVMLDQGSIVSVAKRTPVAMGARPASLVAGAGFGEPVDLSAFKVEGKLVVMRRSPTLAANSIAPFNSYPFGTPWFWPWQIQGGTAAPNSTAMPLFLQTVSEQWKLPIPAPELFASTPVESGNQPGVSPSWRFDRATFELRVSPGIFGLAYAGQLHAGVGPASATGNPIAAANNAFGLDLYQQLRNQDGNVFYSPYSISSVLMMAYAGAGGATQSEMARALHLTLPQSQVAGASAALAGEIAQRGGQGLTLDVANSLWVQQGLRLQDSFLAIARDDYGAGVLFADFARNPEAARLQINQWVERSTNNRIKDMIPFGLLAPATHLILVNAIYFKGRWASPFKAGTTQAAPFFTPAGPTVSAPMMHQQGRFRLAQADDLGLLEMPYAGGSASMVILLPKPGGLPDLEGRLTAENLSRWLDELAQAPPREVAISLPRFRATLGYDLTGTLAQLGMASAFRAGAADFSGIDGARDLYLSDVIHKAFVAVDEEGTEAAAATAVTFFGAAYIRATPFVADHPFLFLIRDNQTGTILFLGRITDPTKP